MNIPKLARNVVKGFEWAGVILLGLCFITIFFGDSWKTSLSLGMLGIIATLIAEQLRKYDPVMQVAESFNMMMNLKK